jgi:hypothetical protein
LLLAPSTNKIPPWFSVIVTERKISDSSTKERSIYGDDDMTNIDKMDNDKILEIAQNMGFSTKNLEELKKFKTQISEMDIWDISKILFFGRTWEQY